MKQREIKFRAWDIKAKKMILPEYADWEDFMIEPDGTISISTETGLYELYRSKTSVTHLELMQFTGLLDKNGKEIYESDRFLFGTIDGIVEYKNGCFVFQGKNCSMTMRDHESNEFEITGNIYQNADLLK